MFFTFPLRSTGMLGYIELYFRNLKRGNIERSYCSRPEGPVLLWCCVLFVFYCSCRAVLYVINIFFIAPVLALILFNFYCPIWAIKVDVLFVVQFCSDVVGCFFGLRPFPVCFSFIFVLVFNTFVVIVVYNEVIQLKEHSSTWKIKQRTTSALFFFFLSRPASRGIPLTQRDSTPPYSLRIVPDIFIASRVQSFVLSLTFVKLSRAHTRYSEALSAHVVSTRTVVNYSETRVVHQEKTLQGEIGT